MYKKDVNDQARHGENLGSAEVLMERGESAEDRVLFINKLTALTEEEFAEVICRVRAALNL